MAVSPLDGSLYVSDAEKHRVLRVARFEGVQDPSTNFEVVAGSDVRCVPGEQIENRKKYLHIYTRKKNAIK